MENDPNNLDQIQLALAAKKGDREARNALFMLYNPRIRKQCWIARQITALKSGSNGPITEEDVEQQAFLIFCALLESWEPSRGTFATYLRRTMPWEALHYVRSMLRYRSRQKVLRLLSLLDLGESEPESVSAEKSLDEVEDREAWDEQTEDLGDEWRQLIEMRYEQGFTSAEIARLYGYSSRTINRELRAATDALREKMQNGWEDCG